MNSKNSTRVRFFLDYGCCLWNDDGCLWPYDDLLSPKTCMELRAFVHEFDASYHFGLPPYEDFGVEDCRRFNRELRRVFALIIADTKDFCIVCNYQMELTEDEAVLAELRERGSDFIDEWREKTYNWSQIEWDD